MDNKNRTAFIGLYLTDREKSRVQDKAEDDNRTVSDYVRNIVIKEVDAKATNGD